jgi:UDP-GlcNAc:undecaprenyl-phosphate GlcNAc-1-phosphate transferase
MFQCLFPAEVFFEGLPSGLHALAGASIHTIGQVFTADEVLSPYIYVFYSSFLVAFTFTPVMRLVASFYGIIDQPDRVRKVHATPVAYLGGVAVFLGWISGLATSQFLHLHRATAGWPISYPVVSFGIVIASLVIIVLGLWDDINGIRPSVKVCGQVIAASFLLMDDVGSQCTRPILVGLMGFVCAAFHWTSPLSGPGHPVFWFDTLVLISSGLLVVLVIVGCCNATNLMDGLDGLCGGVTAIIVAGLLFVAVHLAMTGGGLNTNWDALRVILGLSLLGAVLGFIPFNFNPASIFMGDTGSMFLGFCCGTLIILMAQVQSKWFLAAMVMFALPILDTSLAFARRWIARRPLFSADAQHFHHQLIQRGFSVRQTVMIEYGLSLVFALLGIGIVYVRTRYAVALYLVTFGSIIVAAYKMGMVHERPVSGTPSTLGDMSAAIGGGGTSLDAGGVTGSISPGTVFEIPNAAPTGMQSKALDPLRETPTLPMPVSAGISDDT